jgi:hypothetical protein
MEKFNLKLAIYEKIAKRYVCYNSILYADYLFLTTERFIFIRRQKANIIASIYFIFAKGQVINEIHLADISGISSCVVKNKRTLLIISFLMISHGIMIFIILPSFCFFVLLMICLISGFLTFKLAFKDNFLLELFSSSQTNDVIAKGQNNRQKDLFYSVAGDLTPESRVMLIEIGAIISNLQLLGTKAVDLEKNKRGR